MFEELGITAGMDRATKPDPAMRIVTAGHAVQAMVLNGLGFLHQQRSLVPPFFHNTPLARLLAPGMQASHRNDDTRGRPLETLYEAGVPALSSLRAAPAATRLGLLPTCTPLDSTRFHGEGRYHSAEEPEEHVLHLTRGSSRDRRPDLPQVRLDLLVAPHAGIPVLMKPRSGQCRDPHDCGQIMTDHRAQWQNTSGTPFRVADRAL